MLCCIYSLAASFAALEAGETGATIQDKKTAVSNHGPLKTKRSSSKKVNITEGNRINLHSAANLAATTTTFVTTTKMHGFVRALCERRIRQF